MNKDNDRNRKELCAFDCSSSEILVAVSEFSSTDSLSESGQNKLKYAALLKNRTLMFYQSLSARNLIYESFEIFCRSQREAKSGTMTAEQILSLSLEYRSVIRSAMLSVEDNDDYNEILTVYEIVWCLAENLLMKSDDSSVVFDLLSWARACFSHAHHADEIWQYLHSKCIKDLDVEIFWLQITYFILNGMFQNAVNMLEAFGEITGDKAVRMLADVICDLKMESLNDENTVLEFLTYQREIRNLCHSDHFRSNPDVQKIALLISGDPAVMKMVAGLVDNWYELVPAFALFIQPCASLKSLKEVAKACKIMCGSCTSENRGIEAILSSLFSLDIPHALHEVVTTSSDWWLPAHLIDLLQKAGNESSKVYGVDIRHQMLIDYAILLSEDQDLWKISVGYLKECGDLGLEILESILSSLPLENDFDVLKICDICYDLGLKHICADIYRAMTYKMLRQKKWGAALGWAYRSSNTLLHAAVGKNILLRCRPDMIKSISVLRHFANSDIKCPILSFLHKYQTFRLCLVRDEKEEAANLLVHLVTCDVAAHGFQNVLLDDLIVILNFYTEVVIDKEQTLRLLHYLSSADSQAYNMLVENESQIEILRCALLKNLCNSVVS